jgi:hypothetical protein
MYGLILQIKSCIRGFVEYVANAHGSWFLMKGLTSRGRNIVVLTLWDPHHRCCCESNVPELNLLALNQFVAHTEIFGFCAGGSKEQQYSWCDWSGWSRFVGSIFLAGEEAATCGKFPI